MVDERLIEIYRQHRIGQDKYVYFLLAVAAAAVAYAMKLTSTSRLSYSMIPLGISVLFWGISFYCGCKNIGYVLSTLYANIHLLFIQKGEDSRVGQNPSLIEAASEGVIQAMENNSNTANFYARIQFRFLIAGAVFFLSWHIIEMIIRTII
jgi:hypothetical protein